MLEEGEQLSRKGIGFLQGQSAGELRCGWALELHPRHLATLQHSDCTLVIDKTI